MLFLDEIGELDLELQSKLLRFLQERQVQRVGSLALHPVDVSIIAATNRDLPTEVREGRFREDLFYRLHVVPLNVPPLRERASDIPLLTVFFLERAAKRYGKPVRGVSANAMALLTQYSWPGNIRQLENLMERLVVLCRTSKITVDELPAELTSAEVPSLPKGPAVTMGLQSFEDIEKNTILEAVRRTNGNVRSAAKLLGLGQATLYRKLNVYRGKPLSHST